MNYIRTNEMGAAQLLCKMLGGSRAYGIATPKSDFDYRGCFINTSVADVIGLDKWEHQHNQTPEEDTCYTEFRNCLRQLQKGNSQAIEMIYNEDWITLSDTWKLVIENRSKLVSSEQLYKCLRGYMQGELKLANGERTGKLGSKRKEAIEEFGFSPKNFCNLFRLARAGCTYFVKGFFPVNIRKHHPEFAEMLMRLKTQPQDFNLASLNEEAHVWDIDLQIAYNNRMYQTEFDIDLAHWLCLKTYGPLIKEAMQNFGELQDFKSKSKPAAPP